MPDANMIAKVLLAFFAVIPLISSASSSLPITITSNEASFDQRAGETTYKINVIMQQGPTHLTANIMQSYLNSEHKITKVIATRGKKQVHYWQDETPTQSEFHAFADIIKYFPEQNQIILIGKASLNMDNNTYQSDRIEYNVKTRQLRSPKKNNSKVEISMNVKKGN